MLGNLCGSHSNSSNASTGCGTVLCFGTTGGSEDAEDMNNKAQDPGYNAPPSSPSKTKKTTTEGGEVQHQDSNGSGGGENGSSKIVTTSPGRPPQTQAQHPNSSSQACHKLYSDISHNRTYRTEKNGSHHLLHGLLHIQIVRAKHLRNLDGVRGLSFAPSILQSDKSDPFVEVWLDEHTRIIKTSVVDNNLNPQWMEDHYIPVAHYVQTLHFHVKDRDVMTSESLGKVPFQASELISFDDDMNEERVGYHKMSILNSNPKHGSLEYCVEYIPYNMLSKPGSNESLDCPGVYFKKRMGNCTKLYVNADDGQYATGTPMVTYGGDDSNNGDGMKVWDPPRLWRDIYDAICSAKHFIYITGWAVDTKQSLLRGSERDAALQTNYSPYIGDLLKKKSDEPGMVVNMLVWDDASSQKEYGMMTGMMGTHDEESEVFFQDSKVNFVLAPMLGGETNSLKGKAAKFMMFTHHQKIIIVDVPKNDGSGGREPLAFVGGIDLTDGRWDNANHPLFRTLDSDHKGDAYNGCAPVNVAEVGPREPWHDIHSSVRGPAVLDVLQNFTERWYKQASEHIEKHLATNMEAAGVIPSPPKHYVGTSEEWHTQLFRSIDARTAVFDEGRLNEFSYEPMDGGMDMEGDDMPLSAASSSDSFHSNSGGGGGGTTNHHTHKSSLGVTKLMKKAKQTAKDIRHEKRDRVRRFVESNLHGFNFGRDLEGKKGRDIDASVHTGFVHHIRRAEHTIYIESQYFLGSAHFWPKNQHVKCDNLIPAEITLKILDKIEANERFAVYIVLPMWPEGIPESGSVQAILRWQRLTMEGMYVRIAAALKRRRDANGGIDDGLTPQDYLNFYCLATRETKEGDSAAISPTPNTPEETLARSRRHQVYVHSKMIIVDDTATLIGSANINQRSLDGARDSEIVLASWQPAHVATSTSLPRGDVHAFRMHCWATTTNTFEDVYRHPSSLECVRRINEIAEENWSKYVADDVVEMTSHLVPYPIMISDDGSVLPRPELGEGGFFPDTKARVTGTHSLTLPEILTT